MFDLPNPTGLFRQVLPASVVHLAVVLQMLGLPSREINIDDGFQWPYLRGHLKTRLRALRGKRFRAYGSVGQNLVWCKVAGLQGTFQISSKTD